MVERAQLKLEMTQWKDRGSVCEQTSDWVASKYRRIQEQNEICWPSGGPKWAKCSKELLERGVSAV
jgi:hypothetical protein